MKNPGLLLGPGIFYVIIRFWCDSAGDLFTIPELIYHKSQEQRVILSAAKDLRLPGI
jgi:hypothetical protein